MNAHAREPSRDLLPFVRLLEERIGLDAASIGHDEVGRAVRCRTGNETGRETGGRGAAGARAYYRRLLEEPDEWDEFVEHVLVPETWFFREPAGFELLKRVVGQRLAAGGRCRVLSVPCATGEEPYSMAITLLEFGLASHRVSIEALDISRRVLEKASTAAYDSRSVRHVGAERLAAYFEPAAGRHRLRDAVRRMVSFDRANLVEDDVLEHRGRYDVIFCRNVLIYFTAAARARVLASIGAALHDDGWLVTGHAEGTGLVAPTFVSARIPRTFAYRKAGAPGDAAPPPTSTPRPWARREPAATLPRPARPPVRGVLPVPSVATVGRGRRPGETALSEIERRIDAGDFARAFEACRAYLAQDPGSAEGHYLLGVVASARGDPAAAEDAWRRAIYLDPGHVAALRKLADERLRSGDAREAALLARRADLVCARRR
jgi:chemotaxis protein methyltransferase WspC